MIEIVGISLLSVLGITICAVVFVPLFLLGIAVSVIKLLAPALVSFALGLGIGLGVANKVKEKNPARIPLEIHIETAQESAPETVPVKVKKL